MNVLMKKIAARVGVCVAVLSLVAAQAAPARADNGPSIDITEQVTIDAKGDGTVVQDVQMSARQYTMIKRQNPNVAVLLRKYGLGYQSWAQVEGIKGTFDDGESTVHITFTVRGLARMGQDQAWEVGLTDAVKVKLVAARGNEAILNSTFNGRLGWTQLTSTVQLPAGSKDIRLVKSPERLTFHMPAAGADGGRASADLKLNVKPLVMGSLAKVYSSSKFETFWVARTMFKNTGDQTLHNYQVRFRVANFTPAWSRWQGVEEVVPGQTVVDPYYPLFDLEKLAKMNDAAPADLEVEYRYTRADGQVVEGKSQERIKILGHNQVIFSSMKDGQGVDWDDMTDYWPYVAAAFVTHEDPVIKQVAGLVSDVGGAPMENDDDALHFMKALYEFMVENKIAYQSPPVEDFAGQQGQDVKYGRDVLQNHAGTCVDLSIFYASVCESVGIQTVVYVVPGHVFPAAILPKSGRIIAVESTWAGRPDAGRREGTGERVVIPPRPFEVAVQEGAKEMAELRTHPFHEVMIHPMHAQGVEGLDLPELPRDILDKWGYHRVTHAAPPAPNPQQAPRGNQQPAPAPAPNPPSPPRPTHNEEIRAHTLVGTWEGTTMIAGEKVNDVVTFDEKGNFKSVLTDSHGNTQEYVGTYAYIEPQLSLFAGLNVVIGNVIWVNGDQIKLIAGTKEMVYTRRK